MVLRVSAAVFCLTASRLGEVQVQVLKQVLGPLLVLVQVQVQVQVQVWIQTATTVCR